ncbi:hypothetical protein VTN96DRAFT_1261 [Rasamsonia emersonii]
MFIGTSDSRRGSFKDFASWKEAGLSSGVRSTLGTAREDGLVNLYGLDIPKHVGLATREVSTTRPRWGGVWRGISVSGGLLDNTLMVT